MRKTHPPRGSPSHLGAPTPFGDGEVPISTWREGPKFREQSLPRPPYLASEPTPIPRPPSAAAWAQLGEHSWERLTRAPAPGTADQRSPVPQLPQRHPRCREVPQPHLSPCGPSPNLQPTAPQRRTAGAHGAELSHDSSTPGDGSQEGA